MRSLARFDEMRISGLLPAGAALVYVVNGWIEPSLPTGALMGIVTSMAAAGLLLPSRPVLGRILATIALAWFFWGTLEAALAGPMSGFGLWIAIGWVLLTLWVAPGLPSVRRIASHDIEHPARLARARIALRLVAITALLVAFTRSSGSPRADVAVLVCTGFTLYWLVRSRPWPVALRRAGLAVLALPLLSVFAGWSDRGEFALVILGAIALVVAQLCFAPTRSAADARHWTETLIEHPARQLVLGFALLIALGTLLLGLPVASSTATPVALIDAAFTAVSAVCVTGLIVLDTPEAWSTTGQVIVLVLIQLGGLGIMTFATAFLRALGRRLSLRQEGAAAEMTTQENRLELYAAVKLVLVFTIVAEALGAAVLTAAFAAGGEAWGPAAWRGVFTSVSAFCNAGFALQSDSLVAYASAPLVIHSVALLIVLGGLSPLVVMGLLGRARVGRLQQRLVLVTSLVLLLGGTVLIAAAEWNNVLGDLGVLDKWSNAWFQSVTLRTAGFNTVDIAALHPATITLSMVWMFIGGSPGGTAGGIKTTTFAVLVVAVLATIRGRREVTAFARTIPHATIYRAAAVTTLGLFAVVFLLFTVQLTQDLNAVEAAFEVVSAMGTVGLSMGATAKLDVVGKIVIMVAMFAGRVGSLTMLVFLLARRADDGWQRPTESVDVG
jgi:trk system potassium uptake protein